MVLQVFKAYASYFRYIFTLHPFLYAAPLAIRLGGKGTNHGRLLLVSTPFMFSVVGPLFHKQNRPKIISCVCV